jgi:hypothetical protein
MPKSCNPSSMDVSVSSSRAGGAKLHRAQLRQLPENVTTSSEYWMAVNYHTTSTPKTLAEYLFVMLKKIFVYPSVLFLSAMLVFSAGAEEVRLAWDSNTEPTLVGYRLYYGLGANYSSFVEVGATSTTATVSNLQANQTYVFAVTAFTLSGLESPFSEQVSYTVPARTANSAPVASSTSVQTLEDQSRSITLTGTDANGDSLQFVVTSAPTGGILTGVAPNLTYLPNPNFFGSDSFKFVANDGRTNSAPATISITVSPVNDAPTLNALNSLTVNQNAGQQTVSLSGITSGAANETQTLSVTAVSSNPTLIPNPSINYTTPNSTGALVFTPAANASGTATVTVTVNDGQSQNNTVIRSFTVTVNSPVNRPPIVNAGADKSVTLPAPVSLAGSVTDDGLPNPPGTWTASWRVISGPGTVVFSASASVTSTATFFQAGQYVLRLTANDGALSASDDVQVNVLNGNQVGPVVSQLGVIAADARTITLGWQTDKPALCTVEYGLTSSFGLVAAESTLVPSHLVTLSNLQPATNYFVRIRSADAVTNVSFTDTMVVSTPALTILAWAAEAGVLVSPMAIGSDPTALDGLYISSAISGSGSASFPVQLPVTSQYRAWSRIRTPAGDGAPFYLSLDGAGERLFATTAGEWKSGWRWAAVKTNSLAGPALWLFNLNTDVHQFVFRANDGQTLFDELILSNDPNWVPGIDRNPPVLSTAPTPVNRIDLTWTDATSNEDGFVVERSIDGAQFTSVASLPAGTTTYQDSGLALSTTYYYRIYAFNESDRTEYSNVSAAQTGVMEQSSMAPGNVIATASGGTIRVEWVDNSLDETGFIVERSTDGTNFVTAQTVGANTTQVTDAPQRKHRYYYRVRSFNAYGTSLPSNTATVRLR